jgi:prepilin-type N-terminal cleavage/methylation domain-containing protein
VIAARRRLRAQRGMTLVELLVSLSILAIVGLALTAAVDVGVRILGAGGVPDRLRASGDALAVERSVGADVSRAGCVVTPSAALGACPAAMPAFCTAGSPICLAWPDPAGGCDTVRYRLAGGVLRRDSLTAAGVAGSAELGRQVDALTADAVEVAGWTDAVTVTLDAGPAAAVQRTAFTARPVVTEPRAC